MSVICKTDLCYLVDHKKLLNTIYSQCYDFRQCVENDHQLVKFTANELFFDIKSPFLMDTEALTCFTKPKYIDNKLVPNKHRKKRKHKQGPHFFEDDGVKYHKQTAAIVEQAFSQLQNFTKTSNYFSPPPTPVVLLYNNAGARAAGKFINDCNIDTNSSYLIEKYILPKTVCQHHTLKILHNNIVQYERDYPGIFGSDKDAYILPPRCKFLISDVCDISQLLMLGEKFNVIVIDPPWKNKSVKRKKSYFELSDDDLLMLPITQLAAADCVVLVWATNKLHNIEFVKTTLFPLWNVKFQAQWHWLKITQSGCPVLPLNSPHKKPYENLIVGTIGYEDVGCHFKNIIITSVPSTIHSHKPPLSEILDEYLPPNSKSLELFARSLLPGWTSWGNEVLKLQKLNTLLNEERL